MGAPNAQHNSIHEIGSQYLTLTSALPLYSMGSSVRSRCAKYVQLCVTSSCPKAGKASVRNGAPVALRTNTTIVSASA